MMVVRRVDLRVDCTVAWRVGVMVGHWVDSKVGQKDPVMVVNLVGMLGSKKAA
jgi:hypothetical protein